MNELPPFVYSKAFWEALSLVVSGALALLAFFGKIDPSWAVPASVIAAWVFALLRMFGIVPELKLRELDAKLNKAQRLLEESARLRNDLLAAKETPKAAKSRK